MSLVVYIMAIQSVLGWLLFLVFAGVGLLCTPIDWFQQFLGRPKAVITKSEYMRRAQLIAQRAKQIAVGAGGAWEARGHGKPCFLSCLLLRDGCV